MTVGHRRRARVSAVLSFSSFFVFPAIPIGHTGALTIPLAMAALLAFAWMWRLDASDWRPFAWMMAPPLVSGFVVLLVGSALAPDVVPKAILSLAMAFIVVVPARHLIRAGHGEQFLLGAALAVLVQSALGAYQSIAFDRGTFPFAGLMATNPGQAMTPDQMETYVAYIQRPFGLFAEPSAMAACVGPWLAVMSTALFTGRSRSRRQGAILALALASGLALVVTSRSGQAAPTVAGAAVPAVWAAFSSRRSAFVRGATLLLGVGMVCAATVWLMNNAAARFKYSENESWQGRLESIQLAVESLQSPEHLLVGVGPGQSVAHLTSTALKDRVYGEIGAVASITLAYAMETGLLGLVCMLWVGALIARSIWASRARLAGAACGIAWLVGVAFATTYSQQPALWTAMAMLLSWDSVFGARAAGRPEGRARDEPELELESAS
jgi:hypothetical protein